MKYSVENCDETVTQNLHVMVFKNSRFLKKDIANGFTSEIVRVIRHVNSYKELTPSLHMSFSCRIVKHVAKNCGHYAAKLSMHS